MLMFFQELPSLLSVGKPFPGDIKGQEVKKTSRLKGYWLQQISKLMPGQKIVPYFDPCIYFS